MQLSRTRLSEIDALAVRLPHSAEPEREVGPHELLHLSSEYPDLLICEAKSRGQQLCFNQTLTAESHALAKVLRWSGFFHETEIPALAMKLKSAWNQGRFLLALHPLLMPTRSAHTMPLVFSGTKLTPFQSAAVHYWHRGIGLCTPLFVSQ
jgi:hypothetical protein